jgi:ABC-type nitrate/sulfonate/bicarbonate transport system substrate-binding protein
MRGFVLAALFLAAVVPSSGVEQLTRVEVSLGDVSINKVPQLVAADQGLYAKNGLDVHLTISASAARTAAASGVVVPDAYVNRDASVAAPIEIGGGSPMIYGFVTNTRGAARVIVLTQEAMVMSHIIAKPEIAGIQALKGKRIGFTGVGSVTHFSALSLAKQLGWSPDRDITLVGGSATLDALKQDKVDAIVASAMVIALAPQAGFKDIGDLTAYKFPMAGLGRHGGQGVSGRASGHGAALSEGRHRSDGADAKGQAGVQCGTGQVVQHYRRQDSGRHVRPREKVREEAVSVR